ncbi:unnamed protein product [Rotaria magnacalcarata]
MTSLRKKKNMPKWLTVETRNKNYRAMYIVSLFLNDLLFDQHANFFLSSTLMKIYIRILEDENSLFKASCFKNKELLFQCTIDIWSLPIQ